MKRLLFQKNTTPSYCVVGTLCRRREGFECEEYLARRPCVEGAKVFHCKWGRTFFTCVSLYLYVKLIAKRGEGVERLSRSKMALGFGAAVKCMHTEGRTKRRLPGRNLPPTHIASAKQTTMIRDRYEHDGRKQRQVYRHRMAINQRIIPSPQ